MKWKQAPVQMFAFVLACFGLALYLVLDVATSIVFGVVDRE